MAIFPFYVTTNAEGRKTLIQGGTSKKKGSMRTVLTQRNRGNIETAFSIECCTKEIDGVEKLVSSVYDCNGNLIAEHYTEY